MQLGGTDAASPRALNGCLSLPEFAQKYPSLPVPVGYDIEYG